MSVGKMTSKGQITIPKDVREDLGLEPGTQVSFVRNDEGDYVMSKRSVVAADLIGILAYRGPAVSIEDMNEAIADAAGNHR